MSPDAAVSLPSLGHDATLAWFHPGGVPWRHLLAMATRVRAEDIHAVVVGRLACWEYLPGSVVHRLAITSRVPAEQAAWQLGWSVRGGSAWGGVAMEAQEGWRVLWINRSDYATPLYDMALAEAQRSRFHDLGIPPTNLLIAMQLAASAGPSAVSVDDLVGFLSAGLVDPYQVAAYLQAMASCPARERCLALVSDLHLLRAG